MPAGFLLGAGTVVDAATAGRVIDAGAQFIVSPVFRQEVIDASHKRGIAFMPGCFSPTEILNAWDGGADVVKVFPATALGPGYIKDVRGPLPQVKLMPTGGVTLDNAGEWIKAGAVAVGVGTALLDAKADRRGQLRRARARNAERIVAERARREGSVMTRSSRSARSCCGSARRDSSASCSRRCWWPPSAAARRTWPSASRTSVPRACTSRRCRKTRSAMPRSARCAPKACARITSCGAVDRVGIYYAETGASQRASTVVYDRANSAISEMAPTPSTGRASCRGLLAARHAASHRHLASAAPRATARAIAAAKSAGARVSVDLNYRKKLWSEAKAQEIMGPMMRDVDVVIANEEDLQSVLGVHVPGTDVTSGQLNLDGFRAGGRTVTRDFGPSQVAITLRESLSASDNGWSAVFWDAKQKTLHQSQRYSVRLVDRIGGGDSFAAGLIYGLVTGRGAGAGAAFCRRGERAEADHPWRFQPRHGRRRSKPWPRAMPPDGCSDNHATPRSIVGDAHHDEAHRSRTGCLDHDGFQGPQRAA